MSLMDKIKGFFSGGSAGDSDHDHSGHDHAGHDHTEDEMAAPMPAADPMGMAEPSPAPGTMSMPEPAEPERRDDV
jgi:hypothetical protein